MKRLFSTIFVATTLLMSPVLADGASNGWEHGPMMGYGSGGWMILGPVIWLALIVLILWAAISVFGNGSIGKQRSDQAINTLEQRFAKGEIDAKEFAERKSLLAA
jgi:putative membrane protein